MAYEDYLDDLLHKVQDPKKEQEDLNEDELDFLKEFDDELLNDEDDEFMKDFERELDEEFEKIEINADISDDDNIDFYNELDEIVREVNSKSDEPDSNPEEQVIEIEESAGATSETSYSDDEIWRQFITDDGENEEDEDTGLQEEQNVTDSDFLENEETKKSEDLDIMELLNSIPDYDSLSDIGELVEKDESNEKNENNENNAPVAVDDDLPEDIFSSDVEELYYEDEDIPVISPDSIKENEKDNIISNEKSEETPKKEEGLLLKFFKRFKTSEKKSNKKSDVSNLDALDENSMILNENDAEEIKSKKDKRNSKEKKIKQKEKKQSKLPKIMEPVEPEKPLPRIPVILICILSGSILFFVLITTNLLSYSSSIANAKELFRNQEYSKAYNNLLGLEIKESDETFYNQLRVIMELSRRYSSYENYQQLEMHPESLNALLKGVRQYDNYLEEANNLGISNHFEKVMDKIETALSEKYNISPQQAREINAIEDTVAYTQKVNSILQ